MVTPVFATDSEGLRASSTARVFNGGFELGIESVFECVDFLAPVVFGEEGNRLLQGGGSLVHGREGLKLEL